MNAWLSTSLHELNPICTTTHLNPTTFANITASFLKTSATNYVYWAELRAFILDIDNSWG